MLARMPALEPSSTHAVTPDPDPRPLAPREPALEECCGTGCVLCVFDTYQIALENYERALAAWQARNTGLAPCSDLAVQPPAAA
jgi:hypothetical protein